MRYNKVIVIVNYILHLKLSLEFKIITERPAFPPRWFLNTTASYLLVVSLVIWLCHNATHIKTFQVGTTAMAASVSKREPSGQLLSNSGRHPFFKCLRKKRNPRIKMHLMNHFIVLYQLCYTVFKSLC